MWLNVGTPGRSWTPEIEKLNDEKRLTGGGGGSTAASAQRFTLRPWFWCGWIFFMKTKNEESTCDHKDFQPPSSCLFFFHANRSESCRERKASASAACCAHHSCLGFLAGSVPEWSLSFSVFLPLLSSQLWRLFWESACVLPRRLIKLWKTN